MTRGSWAVLRGGFAQGWGLYTTPAKTDPHLKLHGVLSQLHGRGLLGDEIGVQLTARGP